MTLDADLVFPNLWQGAAPIPGTDLRANGFDVLVLCADEYQPPAEWFPGVRVLHAPNDDALHLTRGQLQQALGAAHQVAQAVRDGQNVLVTCRMGLNRSGLVSALAIYMLTGWPGARCVQQVQAHRPFALSNRYFARLLGKLGGQSATVAQTESYAWISPAF